MKYTCDMNKDDLSSNSANRSVDGRKVGELEIFPVSLFVSLFLLFNAPSQGSGATETGADVRTFMAFGAEVKEQRCHPAGAALPQLGRRRQCRCV